MKWPKHHAIKNTTSAVVHFEMLKHTITGQIVFFFLCTIAIFFLKKK